MTQLEIYFIVNSSLENECNLLYVVQTEIS